MEIYGSKGALVYSLDVTPGVDALEVCIGAPYERVGALQICPFRERFLCRQMQAFADVLNGCGDGNGATIEGWTAHPARTGYDHPLRRRKQGGCPAAAENPFHNGRRGGRCAALP